MNSFSSHKNPIHFLSFKQDINSVPIPDKFNFPFYYEPQPIAILAAKELQEHIENQNEWIHNFGLKENQEGLIIGKMFGVLVVKNKTGELGYLAAFSGKLANENHHKQFVPPVFDLLLENGFFKKEEEEFYALTAKLTELEENPKIEIAKHELETAKKDFENEISAIKKEIKSGKAARKSEREKAKSMLTEIEFEQLNANLNQQSIKEQYYLKDKITDWKNKIVTHTQNLDELLIPIFNLKEERKNKSIVLQNKIFSKYLFLNKNGEEKDLGSIFASTVVLNPPAGAGECAAPKLLQYAFLHDLEPISMAEFWWGQSTGSEIRKHGQFYPACRGKCEPILSHMLKGIAMDENPLLKNPAEGKEIEIVFEDEYLMVVNKPAEFLSVPGIHIQDSVYERIRAKYPQASGPLLVHRLDMSTSGLLLIAKNKDVHKNLQRQFIKRKVDKYYEALLKNIPQLEQGEINLPLRLDIDDRPKQMVCFEFGKVAKTLWEIIEKREGSYLVKLSPITGRTHQLRVHAAHKNGLNNPIIGDDLYGEKADRLYLHAAYLSFTHPISKEKVSYYVSSKF